VTGITGVAASEAARMVIAVFVIVPPVLPAIRTIGEEAQGRLGLTNKLWSVVENEEVPVGGRTGASWVSAAASPVRNSSES
jgi:hypothetical protein